jgi:hypothetical protein
MFIQVISGHTSDPAGVMQAIDRWQQEVRPGAVGFLGETSGVTQDGDFICLARFESVEAARANSDRAEQSAWWEATKGLFDGPVTFHDCSEVDLYHGGGSDTAGFVQVMQGRADPDHMHQLDARVEDELPQWRPDLMGSVRAWHGDGDGHDYTEAAYFTSESDARTGEAQPPPAEMEAEMEEWSDLMAGVTYYDLANPQFVS